MNKRQFLTFFALFAFFVGSTAQASVIVMGTRFVFPADEREISVELTNPESTPALMQVWFDDGNEKSRGENVPFNALPPLFKIAPQARQRLRIVHTKSNLPKDRESIFYINILEIPPKPNLKKEQSKNYLQFSIRSRFKLFYRPKLKMPRNNVERNIDWRLVQKGKQVLLQAKNSTPYFITISDLAFLHKKSKFEHESVFMLKPFSTSNIELNKFNLPISTKGKIEFNSINDFGGKTEFSATNF